MNTVSKIGLLIILAVVILVVGFAAGFIYEKNQTGSVVQKMQEGLKALSSKSISTIVAFGTVSNISGSNITLLYSGSSVTVHMANNANYYSFITSDKKNTAGQNKVSLSDIKTGQNASVNLKLLQNGQLEGISLVLVPAFSAQPISR